MADKFAFDYSITRAAFEKKLQEDFSHLDVDDRMIKKYDAKPFQVIDYYDEGEYIATWSRDRGQIFRGA